MAGGERYVQSESLKSFDLSRGRFPPPGFRSATDDGKSFQTRTTFRRLWKAGSNREAQPLKKLNYITLLSQWLSAPESVQREVLSEARRMAGPAVSRRALIGALAVAPAVTLPDVADSATIPPVGKNVPSNTLTAYRLDYAPADRLQHHILMASLAMEEIARQDGRAGRKWLFFVNGHQSGIDLVKAITHGAEQPTETVWHWHE